jgi:hypothetical protein
VLEIAIAQITAYFDSEGDAEALLGQRPWMMSWGQEEISGGMGHRPLIGAMGSQNDNAPHGFAPDGLAFATTMACTTDGPTFRMTPIRVLS